MICRVESTDTTIAPPSSGPNVADAFNVTVFLKRYSFRPLHKKLGDGKIDFTNPWMTGCRTHADLRASR